MIYTFIVSIDWKYLSEKDLLYWRLITKGLETMTPWLHDSMTPWLHDSVTPWSKQNQTDSSQIFWTNVPQTVCPVTSPSASGEPALTTAWFMPMSAKAHGNTHLCSEVSSDGSVAAVGFGLDFDSSECLMWFSEQLQPARFLRENGGR